MDDPRLYAEVTQQIRLHPTFDAFVAASRTPAMISTLFAIVKNATGSEKFFCEKTIRKISETDPAMIYPHFDELVAFLQCRNHFIRWGAIITLAHLIAADRNVKFPAIYETYLGLLASGDMIAANNVILQIGTILSHYPAYEDDLTTRLLATKRHTYIHQGEVSPECQNIVLGQVIDAFDLYVDRSPRRDDILAFVRAELANTRPAVARKAARFIRKHAP